jgi:hypothetical protein
MNRRWLLPCLLIVLTVAGCWPFPAPTPTALVQPSPTTPVQPSPTTAVSPSPSPTLPSPAPTETLATPVPAAGPQIPGFGINYVYHGLKQYQKSGGTPEAYIVQQNEKLCDLGVGWIRSGGPGDPTSFHWPIVEPQAGVFDFSLSDLRAQESDLCGLSMLGNVEFSVVPDYAQVAGTYFDDTRYLEYLNAIVERYDGDGLQDMPGLAKPIKFWEIGNEVVVRRNFAGTPQDYAHVLQISYQAIKASCPDCQVLIGGWIIGKRDEQRWQNSLSYFDQVLAAGGGNYFDIMNYHEYTPDGDFLTYYHVNGFNQVLAKYGFDKPMWITEGNTPLVVNGQAVYTVERQAQDLVKRIVIAFDAGVEVYFWHGLDDARGSPGSGLVDENGTPKPDYYSLKLLISKINGFSSVERLDLGNEDLYFYQFGVGNDLVYVLWTEAGDATLDLGSYFGPSSLTLTYAITQANQTQPTTVQADGAHVPVTKTPVFIAVHP